MSEVISILIDKGFSGIANKPDIDQRVICPKCFGGSTKEKSLSLKLDRDGGATWICHRASCSWRGNIPSRRNIVNFKQRAYIMPQEHMDKDRADWVDEYFAARGISLNTLDDLNIYSTFHFQPEAEKKLESIVFPYYLGGELQRRKYRAFKLKEENIPFIDRIEQKYHAQDKDSPPSLFNIDNLDEEMVVWAEGEVDVAALYECGFRSSVSLPDGAPKVPLDGKPIELGQRLLPINLTKSKLDKVKLFILAGDNDDVGIALMKAIESVLGARRCKFVQWPKGCKDAAETLQKHGPDAVRSAVENAQFSDKVGLVKANFMDALELMSDMEIPGLDLGLPDLDKIFKLPPHGGFALFTGQPGKGKSSFTNWMIARSIINHGWHWAIFAGEGHGGKGSMISLMKTLAYLKLERFQNPRLTDVELEEAFNTIQKHCVFLDTVKDESKRIDKIKETIEWTKTMRPLHGVLLDPINEVNFNHNRKLMREDEHMNEQLSDLSNWSYSEEIALCMVAHPRTLRKGKDGKVAEINGYDIAGGAPFFNKVDSGYTISRDEDDGMIIDCWKARYNNWSKLGRANLHYNWQTGLITPQF